MAVLKILMSNLGYLRGINGKLLPHLLLAHRHFYASAASQRKAQRQLMELITAHDPDICCFVEIDKGSSNSAYFNQIEALVSERYSFFDIENKYGAASQLRRLPFTRGKSNAFLSKNAVEFEKISFECGTKRLIYKLQPAPGITLFFAHFSLKRKVRMQQLLQVSRLLKETPGASIFLGDFNILGGLKELSPLLQQGELVLVNDTNVPTFIFHRTQKLLDLCLCSPQLASSLKLQVIPQPFSDHAALFLEIALK